MSGPARPQRRERTRAALANDVARDGTGNAALRKLAAEQLAEERISEADGADAHSTGRFSALRAQQHKQQEMQKQKQKQKQSRHRGNEEDDSDDEEFKDGEDDEEEDDGEFDAGDADVAGFLMRSSTRDVYDVDAYNVELGAQLAGLSDADERLVAMFMPGASARKENGGTGSVPEPVVVRNLGDIIMQKIAEAEELAAESGASGAEAIGTMLERRLEPKVIEVYRGVGQVLRRFRAGRLPKAFKIIPALSNWEEILWLTDPTQWSKQAMHQATRLFASNLNPRMAQRFYNHVLLPCVRADIQENRKLNFHLYLALKKSMYKPGAFFKGVLLPLTEAGDCTLREAVIISSVVHKVHVPALHSSAAMLRLAELPYTGASSVFLTTLLDKKYALPYRVVDALVDHFLRFCNDRNLPDGAELPILWHRSLLTFVQRYKSDLLALQKEHLQTLLRLRHHHYFSDEIRRELVNSTCRGETGQHGTALVRDQQTEETLMDLM